MGLKQSKENGNNDPIVSIVVLIAMEAEAKPLIEELKLGIA